MPRKGTILSYSSSDEDEVRIILSQTLTFFYNSPSDSLQTPEARRARTTIVMDISKAPWVSIQLSRVVTLLQVRQADGIARCSEAVVQAFLMIFALQMKHKRLPLLINIPSLREKIYLGTTIEKGDISFVETVRSIVTVFCNGPYHCSDQIRSQELIASRASLILRLVLGDL